MNDVQTREQIVELIRQASDSTKAEIQDADHLINDLGMTSLSYIELIVGLEMEFNIALPDDYLIGDDQQTVGQLVQAVEELCSQSIGHVV